MKANKYQDLALKTALLDRPLTDQVLNAVLGLSGEAGELCEILNRCNTGGGDGLVERYLLLMKEVGGLGDEIKKNMFHGHAVDKVKLMKMSSDISFLAQNTKDYIDWRDIEFDSSIYIDEESEQEIEIELGDSQWYIALGCWGIKKNLSDIMKMNIAKLVKRFGEKFSFAASINRSE